MNSDVLNTKAFARSTFKRKGLFDQVLGIFSRFDANGDGSIDRQELGRVLSRLDETWTESRIDALMRAIDVGRDQRIQFEELLRWVFGGRGNEQHVFRGHFNLDSPEVMGAINVTVKNLDGEVVFGPEELLGSMTVAWLRRRVRAHSGQPAGCLCDITGNEANPQAKALSTSLRDSMVLGVYCEQGPNLTCTVLGSALSLLSPSCVEELRKLRAWIDMGGRPAIHLGKGRRLPIGEEGYDVLLTSDGRILAKAYRCLGYDVPKEEELRLWRYEIAEGSFTILDAEMCHMELGWRRWAVRNGKDEGIAKKPSEDALGPWEMREVDETQRPDHMIPSASGLVTVLKVARSWLQNRKESYESVHGDPLAGFPMPDITEDVLYDLEMDIVNLPYWLNGKKIPGPWGEEVQEESFERSEIFT
eukprot:TRINITY_DN76618_c0_g1_i1.p1 TRINITY_DN76618_c0_g1~~TRINITY_DN76618_c0_g1_i1.p1  ORF type:complete len:427 (+),score=70.01 TRINITY_DN76618_c0_g1_i1:32-1282(+)